MLEAFFEQRGAVEAGSVAVIHSGLACWRTVRSSGFFHSALPGVLQCPGVSFGVCRPQLSLSPLRSWARAWFQACRRNWTSALVAHLITWNGYPVAEGTDSGTQALTRRTASRGKTSDLSASRLDLAPHSTKLLSAMIGYIP